MISAPDISVVIPTRERWTTLERTLGQLARQELAGVRAEVIVVDNGSGDGSWESLHVAVERWDAAPVLTALREPIRGPSAARNTGVLAARAELVLFLGDDCVPAGRDLLAGHVRAHKAETQRGLEVGVVGLIAWDPGAPTTHVMRWLERRGKIVDYHRLAREEPGPFAFYTGNVSVPRRAIVETGGFDRRFGIYGWEDHDLAIRLEERSFRLLYRPELVVHHRHRYDLRQSLARMETMGRTANLLNRLHSRRRPSPAPRPTGPKGAAGRILAPTLTRLPDPARLPASARDAFYRAAHFAALARGYGGAPLPVYPRLPDRLEPASPPGERPAVSVVVPFRGGPDEARRVLERIGAIALSEKDELLVADNTDGQVVAQAANGLPVTTVPATGEHSPAFARNRAAERARGEWLLFVDADCRPPPDLIERYFAEPIGPRCAALAGTVVGAAEQTALAARYAGSREYLRQDANLRDPHGPRAALANLLVRRSAWEEVGGLTEGVRCAEDTDLCWRLLDADWELGYREQALVEHLHRESLREVAVQNARYVAGAAWLNRRYPGAYPREKTAARLLRCAGGILAWTATARFERALFKAIDALVIASESVGWHMDNSAARGPASGSAGRPSAP